MGIWYESKLIVGWEIQIEKLNQFLQSHQFKGCGEHDIEWNIQEGRKWSEGICSNCLEYMDDIPLPEGFTIERSDPYFDCDPKHRHYFLTLANVAKHKHNINDLISKLQSIDWNISQKLAIQLGADDLPPKVFSTADVC